MDNLKLTNKIRVVPNLKKVERCPENRLDFYTDYALVVSETLKKPLFQKFLDALLKREEIENASVKDIQIRMFPFQNENGKFLAGRCNSEGVIRIFPKRRMFFKRTLREHKNENAGCYLQNRAMAALIHEILHVKYESDESKVKQLTKKYFGIFVRHPAVRSQHMSNIQKMLFAC
ncbi:MAG: hypothetical protein WC325_08105 [Candidatus Bathyarchaeia archaeon]|jgi:hypothetical protein